MEKKCELGCISQYEMKLVDAQHPKTIDRKVVVGGHIATPLFRKKKIEFSLAKDHAIFSYMVEFVGNIDKDHNQMCKLMEYAKDQLTKATNVHQNSKRHAITHACTKIGFHDHLRLHRVSPSIMTNPRLGSLCKYESNQILVGLL